MMWIKFLFMHFVKSIRWHCTILVNFTRLNEDIVRVGRGVFDIRPEWRSNSMTKLKIHWSSLLGGLAVSAY